MKIEKVQDYNLKDIVLISALPDMGKVGGLVTQHLLNKLKTKLSSKIILTDKPWVNLKEGIINLPSDEYTLSVDKDDSIVIFSGENQPQEPGTVFEIANSVLSTVSKMGNIKMVISAGGYLPNENAKRTKVFGVATTPESLQKLKTFGVAPLSSEVNTITWFNGLILGLAKNLGVTGIGLFGEIQDVDAPQYKAASNIIKTMEKIIGIEIDTSELDQKISEKTPEVKKEGPGIG